MENHWGAYRITKYYKIYAWRITGVLTESLVLQNVWVENHWGAYRITEYYKIHEWRITGVLTESLVLQNVWMENHWGAYRIIGTIECMNGESLGCLQNHWYYRMYEWRITKVLTESLVLQNVWIENHWGATRIIGTTECMNGESLGCLQNHWYYRMYEWRITGCLQNHWYYRMYEWRITGVLTESLNTTECINGESLGCIQNHWILQNVWMEITGVLTESLVLQTVWGAYRIIGTTECMNGESLGCLQNHWYYRMYEWRIIWY